MNTYLIIYLVGAGVTLALNLMVLPEWITSLRYRKNEDAKMAEMTDKQLKKIVIYEIIAFSALWPIFWTVALYRLLKSVRWM